MCKELKSEEKKKGVCTCVWYICFTSQYFCYESLPEAEQITVNGTISETWWVKGGIQIKVLLASRLLPLHLHNYHKDTEPLCLHVCVIVCLE